MDDISNGLIFVIVVSALVALVTLVAMMKVFAKAGKSGLLALVPLVNLFVFLRVIRKPAWWVVGFLLPSAMAAMVAFAEPDTAAYMFAGAAVLFVLWVIFMEQVGLAVARVFNKDDSFAVGVLFFPFVYYPILGFGKATYRTDDVGPARERTYLGKVFVLVYGVFALVCLMTAVAVYTQQMNFVLPKGETSKGAKSRVDEAIEVTKTLQKANNRALTRWIGEADEVAVLEADQALRREFYRGQIELVRTGELDGKKVDNPVQELARDAATGSLRIDQPTGRKPIQVGLTAATQVNARPQSEYKAGLKQADDEIKRLGEEIKKDVAAETVATNKINDTADMKGLRTRIKEQDQIAEDADAEALYLEDFITNRRADAQLFVKRRDALQASINRLVRFFNKQPGAPGS